MSNVYGLDIGTSNFKMCCKDKVLNEKNIIAIANKNELLAFGDEAYEMYEKAPENIEVSFPVKFGVIADIENMQTLLLSFFNKINDDKKNSGNNDFYIAVPTDVTEVEKRAFYELVAESKVKAKNIFIVDKPVADAIGAGLDVTKSKPDPEVFLVAASKLELSPENCLVVEDAQAGIEAAKAGGMKSLGVGPFHDELGADFHSRTLATVDNWEEILC